MTQDVDEFQRHLYQVQNLETLVPPKSTNIPLLLLGRLSTVIVIFLPASHSPCIGYSILSQGLMILYQAVLHVHPHQIGLIVLHDVYRDAGEIIPAHDTPGRV